MMPIRDALDGLVRRLGLSKRAGGFRIMELWADVAGPQIARRTAPVRVADGILFVDVESPAWASQLTFMKHELVDRLNAKAGEVYVRDIRFRSRSLRKAGDDWRGEDPGAPGEVASFLRSVRADAGDCDAAERIAGGGSPLQGAMRGVIVAHRRLGRARSMAGWETCPECGRMYHKKLGHCPRCGSGDIPGGTVTGGG